MDSTCTCIPAEALPTPHPPPERDQRLKCPHRTGAGGPSTPSGGHTVPREHAGKALGPRPAALGHSPYPSLPGSSSTLPCPTWGSQLLPTPPRTMPAGFRDRGAPADLTSHTKLLYGLGQLTAPLWTWWSHGGKRDMEWVLLEGSLASVRAGQAHPTLIKSSQSWAGQLRTTGAVGWGIWWP